MSYSKKELINKLIEFENERGHLPTRQDFKVKKITPSHATFYRIFNGKENMIKELELYKKGELVFDTKEKIFEKKPKFRCPFCGSSIQEPFDYNTCKDTIRRRLIDRLNKNGNKDYSNGVIDSLVDVLGRRNQEVEQALRKEGLLGAYLERLEETNNSQEEYNSESQS